MFNRKEALSKIHEDIGDNPQEYDQLACDLLHKYYEGMTDEQLEALTDDS